MLKILTRRNTQRLIQMRITTFSTNNKEDEEYADKILHEVLNHAAYKPDEMVIAFDQTNRFLGLIPKSESNKDIKVQSPPGSEEDDEGKQLKIQVWHRTATMFVHKKCKNNRTDLYLV